MQDLPVDPAHPDQAHSGAAVARTSQAHPRLSLHPSGSVLGAHTAVKHGSKFVRVAFIAIVIALILKTAADAWSFNR